MAFEEVKEIYFDIKSCNALEKEERVHDLFFD